MKTPENNEIAIRAEHVSKNFILPHEKSSSLKGAFTGLLKSKNRGNTTQHALRDISFEINKGEFFGIVGRNGSGKSTMLKILAGIYQPTKGTINVAGKLVPFIELGVGFNMELTGRENIYLNGALLGFSKSEMEAQYADIVSFAELSQFMDQKLKNYSSGMQVRLAFSLAIRAKADILLFDEVLAVGDADFQRKCFNHFRELKKEKKTVVFVSHDMNAVREYCDRALLIDKSKVVALGSANDIARDYSRMFMESSSTENATAKDTKRWGNGSARYTAIIFHPTGLSDESKLEIDCEVTAHQDLDEIICGFAIKTASGQNLLGSNTQLKRQKIRSLKKDQKLVIKWQIPNIFADGTYSFEPSIILFDSEVCDWWEDAKTFEVRKEDHTAFIAAPEIELSIGSEGNL